MKTTVRSCRLGAGLVATSALVVLLDASSVASRSAAPQFLGLVSSENLTPTAAMSDRLPGRVEIVG